RTEAATTKTSRSAFIKRDTRRKLVRLGQRPSNLTRHFTRRNFTGFWLHRAMAKMSFQRSGGGKMARFLKKGAATNQRGPSQRIDDRPKGCQANPGQENLANPIPRFMRRASACCLVGHRLIFKQVFAWHAPSMFLYETDKLLRVEM